MNRLPRSARPSVFSSGSGLRLALRVLPAALLFFGCASIAPTGTHPVRAGDTVAADALTSPRLITLEFLVRGTVEEVLSGDALAARNRELGIPETTPPTLLYWSSDLRNHFGQQGVERLVCSPAPTGEQAEAENGNVILFWDFTDRLRPGETFTLRRVYRLTLYTFDPRAFPPPGARYDPASRDFMFYTKSEPFNETTPEIHRAAQEAIGNATAPLEQARRLFGWVRRHMAYQYPPPGGRGATIALREGKGDCGQYADLFVSLCRSTGIPARFVGGFALGDPGPNGLPSVGSHAWAEFMLPEGRWVVADPTGEEESHFGRLLESRHVTAAVGRNIPLPHAPSWAAYRFGDVEKGRTEFMQTLTEVCTGAKVKTTITRTLVK